MGCVTGRIVVGVDGSPGSDAALAWAAAHAPAFGARVVAVHCWSPPLAHEELAGSELEAMERDFVAVLDTAVERAAAEAPGVLIERVLSRGEPTEVLTDLADGAALLVLGGSVSRRATDRATCPVVIVPMP
jgi:nucleotide-binding universal stress UspA family protein